MSEFCKRTLRKLRSIGAITISRLRLRWVAVSTVGLSAARSVQLLRHVDIAVTDGGSLKLSEETVISQGTAITVQAGRMTIGPRCFVGRGCVLVAREYISIGADCLIAEGVSIRDQDHSFDFANITAQNGFDCAPIFIGDNVWIGARAVILKGVKIGENSVIAAGAVVTKDVSANCVVGGVPARIIRQRDGAAANHG